MGPKSRRVPQELRQRTEHSCDRCKSRKQKCSTWPGQDKCNHCQKYGYSCVITKPRKQRLYGSVEGHSARVAMLESLVKGLMPEADLSNLESMQEMASALGIPMPDTSSTADVQSSSAGTDSKEEENEHLVHDLQGQGQYIGRASSYFFQMKLRALVGRSQKGTVGRMYLFGPNPASSRLHPNSSLVGTDTEETLDIHSIASATSPSSGPSPASEPTQADHSIVFMLVRIFFDRINVDFPVLHEATFLESLDGWCRAPKEADQVWLCSFLCVLILARRLCDVHVSDYQEEKWWCRIQSLLSKVMFTSSLTSIQALMLAALHLHNTNSRDICWTLTGAAVRIGFAIGLHRDGLETNGTPLAREMRKRIWWTLYSFEQLQVSSHDRPSAIDSAKHLAGSPRETILGMGTHNIPDYITWSNRLVMMLGSACRALPDAAKDGYSGPLSPAAGLLRELIRWRTGLPQHLSMDSIDAMPPSFQRPLILLHVQYHYIVSLISRYALLSRFTALSKSRSDKFPEPLISMSDVCIESGRLSCQLLLKLDSTNNFNAVTWLDVYYLYSSALILVLSIICDIKQDKQESAAEARRLLIQCTDLAAKHLRNPMVPGTMHRWLTVVGELNIMIVEFTGGKPAESRALSPVTEAIETCVPDFTGAAMQFVFSAGSNPRLEGVAPLRLQDQRDTALVPVNRPFETGEVTSRQDMFMPGLLPSPDSGYDPNFQHALGDPSDPRAWHELHWEGISDMLLGMETRTWAI